MNATTLVALAFCVFAFGLISRRIENSPITAPMLFAALGLAAGPSGFGLIELSLDEATTHAIVELALILVLFTDASRIRLRDLRAGFRLPARLLLVGLPLTIALGLLAGRLLFPSMTVAEVGLLAAILAPTDAALGQVVVSSRQVPVRIRQALNVESGLNDGIAVPVVAVLLVAAVTLEAGHTVALGESEAGLGFAVSQIGLGPVAGLVVACPAGWLVQRATATDNMSRAYQHFAGVAVAVGAFGVAELLGGNGFIAAFIAGLVVGGTSSPVCESLQEFAEEEGQLLALFAFLVFGAVMLPPALEAFDWHVVLYVALSLSVVRMLPVAVALVGSGLRLPTVGFLGWFGPRGLATILFALLVSEAELIANHERIFHIATLTVAASILAHGLSAAPLAAAYGKWAERIRQADPTGPECHDVPELPVRVRPSNERAPKSFS